MGTQIKIFTRLELLDFFGVNVYRHTRDPRARRRCRALTAAWVLVAAVLMVYMGALSFGLIVLGLAPAVPAYLAAVAGLLTFFFGIFKAGSVLFRPGGYDGLCALPVHSGAIVTSRFLRMYAEDLAMTLAVLLPGLGVYVWMIRPGVEFCLLGALGVLFLPLLPMAGATLAGTLVTALSSRMKHKSLIAAALTIGLVLAILWGSARLTEIGEITDEMAAAFFDTVLAMLGRVYPPAVWFGSAVVKGDWAGWLLWALTSAAAFGAVAAGVSVCFHPVCRRLYSTSARHDYHMGAQRKSSVLWALCVREFRRYFSSAVYVTNTIMGPIMGTLLAGGLLAAGVDTLAAQLPAALDIGRLAPFAVAAAFCLMTTTATSVSMEGKNWWIAKSLPLPAKTILDAKLLMDLLLMLPFYILSEGMLIAALSPSPLELLRMVLAPGAVMLFSCVYGITVNLALPSLDWKDEVTVVKQSGAAALGGMGGSLLALIWGAGGAFVPGGWAMTVDLAFCVVLLGVTAVLYARNNRTRLENID